MKKRGVLPWYSHLRIAKTLSYCAVIISVFCGICTGARVTLSARDSTVSTGQVRAGLPLHFGLEISLDAGDTVYAVSNGFRIYSGDGATWVPRLYLDTMVDFTGWTVDTTEYVTWSDSIDWTVVLCCWKFARAYSNHDNDPVTPDEFGSGADTVGMGGFNDLPGTGIIGPASLTAWYISIDSVTSESIGKTLCIDSGSFSLGAYGEWLWVLKNDSIIHPEWDGPHCFEIVADCCENLRGNINLDHQDTIDISDLTYLVGWMFKSGSAPPCMLEADVDGNGGHDIADVTFLVGYMFKGGPEPAGCP